METSGVIAAHTHETKMLHHSTNTSNVPIAILLSRGQRRNTANRPKQIANFIYKCCDYYFRILSVEAPSINAVNLYTQFNMHIHTLELTLYTYILYIHATWTTCQACARLESRFLLQWIQALTLLKNTKNTIHLGATTTRCRKNPIVHTVCSLCVCGGGVRENVIVVRCMH